MCRGPWPIVLAVLLTSSCRPRAPVADELGVDAPPSPTGSSVATTSADEGPVRTEDVDVPGDLPAVVVRGSRSRSHARRLLFVPGMCVHPGGYVMSFQHAAAAHGDLVALQGDVPCGEEGTSARRWSADLDAMNRRVDAAFAAAGLGAPHDVLVIGYSQGAERAEKLLAGWPSKYSSAILIASPITPSPRVLSRAHAVATMAGTFDIAKPRMRATAEALAKRGHHAAFFELPNARHGQMGDEPETTMNAALDFVVGPPLSL